MKMKKLIIFLIFLLGTFNIQAATETYTIDFNDGQCTNENWTLTAGGGTPVGNCSNFALRCQSAPLTCATGLFLTLNKTSVLGPMNISWDYIPGVVTAQNVLSISLPNSGVFVGFGVNRQVDPTDLLFFRQQTSPNFCTANINLPTGARYRMKTYLDENGVGTFYVNNTFICSAASSFNASSSDLIRISVQQNDYIDNVEMTFTSPTPPCTPSWECVGYGNCDQFRQSCNTVNDTNSCGTLYSGNFSEFSQQICGTTSPPTAAATQTVTSSTQQQTETRDTRLIFVIIATTIVIILFTQSGIKSRRG